MRRSTTSPKTGTAPEVEAGHGHNARAARRRVALVTAGAAVCALGGAALGGFGGSPVPVASASGIAPSLPSGFPSGTPALPEFPTIAELLTSSISSPTP